MEEEQLTRRTYNGSKTRDGHIVSAVRFETFPDSHMLKTTSVESIDDYSSGCRLHAGCFGHMCRTPQGNILPPHALAVRVGPISTEYLKAASMAFDHDPAAYKDALKRTNYTKRGHMRAIMSTPVAGSMRLVAVPQIHLPRNCVCIPKELAEATVFCAHETNADGEYTGRMVERSMQEGDYVMLVRPPSLTWLSTQPMKVVFWDKPCIGIKPEAFTGFHGDFDGDEAHCYPLSSKESLWEASNWVVPELPKFAEGRKMMAEVGIRLGVGAPEDHAHFIEYTTLSSKQLKDGDCDLYFGEQSRNPRVYVEGTSRRFSDPNTELDFVSQSVRGTMDILRQQLSQSSIGEMTRNAKVSVSSFYRTEGGDLCVQGAGRTRVLASPGPDPGSPSMRAVMLLCSKAQQSALDAHRVGSSENKGFDFIADIFKPVDDRDAARSRVTLCIFGPACEAKARALSSWCTRSGDVLMCLIRPYNARAIGSVHIVGAYNPQVLELVEESRRPEVCAAALRAVMDFYGCDYDEAEVHDLAYALSYQPESSHHPITSREGALDRDIGWVDQLLMTDYSKLGKRIQSFNEAPETSTCAMYLSNFSSLKEKHS